MAAVGDRSGRRGHPHRGIRRANRSSGVGAGWLLLRCRCACVPEGGLRGKSDRQQDVRFRSKDGRRRGCSGSECAYHTAKAVLLGGTRVEPNR